MQSKKQSVFEACVQQSVGFLVALLSQMLIFPIFDININITENLQIAVYFAIVSSVRSYCIRRYFNKRHKGEMR